MPIPSLTYVLAAAADAAGPVPEKLLTLLGSGKGLILVVGSQIGAILACWFASMLFAGEKATMGRAFLSYIGALAAGVLAVVLFSLVTPIVAQAGDSTYALPFAVAVGVILIAVLVLVPIKVYQIDLFSALGFVLTTFVIGFAFNVGIQMAVFGDEVSLDTTAVRELLVLPTPPPPTPPPVDRATLLEELRQREAELSRWNERLSIQYKHMPLGNTEAAANYAREKAAYDREFEQFRADAAALGL